MSYPLDYGKIHLKRFELSIDRLEICCIIQLCYKCIRRAQDSNLHVITDAGFQDRGNTILLQHGKYLNMKKRYPYL